jgi:4-amino-4-deoxy-L-arabinose transferase-like glycosyltransferase
LNSAFDITHPRSTRWIAPALFMVTILSRLPFQSQYLYHWDSVNMAFGVLQFDVANGAPQYPGYIVYIAIAQLANLFFDDPQRTMVFISLLSSGLGVVTLFYLGREMFNPVTGLIAALFLVASPLFWFYGEIALPHTFALFLITLCAGLLYKILIGQTRWLWWTIALVALMGGFRLQDLFFLSPLILVSCYRLGLWRILAALLLGGLVTVVWFIPLLAYSGGFRAYLDGSAAYTASFFTTTSIFSGAGEFGLRRNILNKLIPYTLYGWSLAVLPALYWLWLLSRRISPPLYRRAGLTFSLTKLAARRMERGLGGAHPHLGRWLTKRKFWFLLLWITPAVVFYAIVHMGQQGLVFVFLPALFLISAHGLYRLLARYPSVLWAVTTIILIVGAVIFIFVPAYPLGQERIKLLTYDTLRQHDQLIANQMNAVREYFKPGDTVLLAASWRFWQYYLPEYNMVRFNIGAKFEVEAGQATGGDFVNQPVSAAELGLPAAQSWRIALMDEDMLEFAASPLEQVALLNGFSLRYLPMQPDALYITDGKTFGKQ